MIYLIWISITNERGEKCPDVWIPTQSPLDARQRLYVLSRIHKNRPDILSFDYGLMMEKDGKWVEWRDEYGRDIHHAFELPMVLDVEEIYGGQVSRTA